MSVADDQWKSPAADFGSMRDEDIEKAIERHKSTEKIASRLPDKGAKLRALIHALEDELRRRRLLTPAKVVDGGGKHMGSKDLGVYEWFREGTRPSMPSPDSKFGSIFSRKMEENAEAMGGNAFDKELASLDHGDKQKKRPNEIGTYGQIKKSWSTSREWPSLSTPRFSFTDKLQSSDGDEKIKASSNCQFHLKKECHSAGLLQKKNPSQDICLRGSRTTKVQPVELVDLDEDEMPVKTTELLPDSVKDVKIYFPSREDRESVEICYVDMGCLAPQSYLTSPIMSFYIRYLQLHASPLDVCDYHFFNTFFYNKLKQELAYEEGDKELSFAKFRRWWKGVDLFRNSYVLIPINDELHWSLVIVCILDKEDESGPIVLHLDSLGLHDSRSIFETIRKFLIAEWKFISLTVAPPDVPIADKIWKFLPRRIETEIISVPQQTNEYDCGLFVLFFIQRFMEEAPERLKKRDLSMFGNRWFKPEQASALRAKIRRLLTSEFEKIQACTVQPSSSSDDSV